MCTLWRACGSWRPCGGHDDRAALHCDGTTQHTLHKQAVLDLQAAKRDQAALRSQLVALRKQTQQAEAAAQAAHKELTTHQAQQERLHKRHAEIYARLQQVMVRHRGAPSAGAVAAAARELRPLELVAVFDRQQQTLEVWAAR